MRLTEPVPLDPANAHVDAHDIARCILTSTGLTELGVLRWGKVSPDDHLKNLSATLERQIVADSAIPRIGASDSHGNKVERREHLVVRDLDLSPFLLENESERHEKVDQNPTNPGRIVAHADFRYRPKGWDCHIPHPSSQDPNLPPELGHPPGTNVPLDESFDEQVDDMLDFHMQASDCYELVSIATSTTHQRKGIAKKLVTWIYPYADRDAVNLCLAASPMGLPLYKSCGFLEGEGDNCVVEIALEEWGGKGKHQHVFMVRTPV